MEDILMTQGIHANEVLSVQDLGMEPNSPSDRIVFGLAAYAEATVRRWIQFPRGALVFLMVPGDPESGCFYVLDRVGGAIFMLDPPVDGRWGGYRIEECDPMIEAHALKRYAERPQRLLNAS
jgi:hypothetical protein